MRKDLDLGLGAARNLDVAMPVTAATREALQGHIGAAQQTSDPDGYLAKDFAMILQTIAAQSGVILKSEDTAYPTGLEISEAAE